MFIGIDLGTSNSDECRNLMAANGYSSSDMDRIVLIGGPTRMPYVRECVGFELGIALDTSIDPMTSVARGAAIYASGRDWSGSGDVRTKTVRETKTVESPLSLSFEYVDNTAASEIRLRVKSSAVAIPSGTVIQVDAENG